MATSSATATSSAMATSSATTTSRAVRTTIVSDAQPSGKPPARRQATAIASNRATTSRATTNRVMISRATTSRAPNSPRNDAPRFVQPRAEATACEAAARRTPRAEAPRVVTTRGEPAAEAPRFESPAALVAQVEAAQVEAAAAAPVKTRAPRAPQNRQPRLCPDWKPLRSQPARHGRRSLPLCQGPRIKPKQPNRRLTISSNKSPHHAGFLLQIAQSKTSARRDNPRQGTKPFQRDLLGPRGRRDPGRLQLRLDPRPHALQARAQHLAPLAERHRGDAVQHRLIGRKPRLLQAGSDAPPPNAPWAQA